MKLSLNRFFMSQCSNSMRLSEMCEILHEPPSPFPLPQMTFMGTKVGLRI